MKWFPLVLVPAALAACASDRAALERIDERLARIEARLGSMEERTAALPQVPPPTLWYPSVWTSDGTQALQYPAVLPPQRVDIAASGGCVLPGRPVLVRTETHDGALRAILIRAASAAPEPAQPAAPVAPQPAPTPTPR